MKRDIPEWRELKRLPLKIHPPQSLTSEQVVASLAWERLRASWWLETTHPGAGRSPPMPTIIRG